MQPRLIGIAGASGSGKTALAEALLGRLPGTATLLSLDSYYRELAHLPLADRARQNFDHPDALDAPLLVAQLRDLAAGKPVASPIYEFDTHSRAPRTHTITPGDFVIVEGLFALYWEDVRALLDWKVFVLTQDDVCFARRLARDVAERGRSPESVRSQYEQTVRPMAIKFVLPTRAFAGLVVSGEAPLEEAVAAVLRLVPSAARASA